MCNHRAQRRFQRAGDWLVFWRTHSWSPDGLAGSREGLETWRDRLEVWRAAQEGERRKGPEGQGEVCGGPGSRVPGTNIDGGESGEEGE